MAPQRTVVAVILYHGAYYVNPGAEIWVWQEGTNSDPRGLQRFFQSYKGPFEVRFIEDITGLDLRKCGLLIVDHFYVGHGGDSKMEIVRDHFLARGIPTVSFDAEMDSNPGLSRIIRFPDENLECLGKSDKKGLTITQEFLGLLERLGFRLSLIRLAMAKQRTKRP